MAPVVISLMSSPRISAPALARKLGAHTARDNARPRERPRAGGPAGRRAHRGSRGRRDREGRPRPVRAGARRPLSRVDRSEP